MAVPEGMVAVTAPLGLRPARGSMIWGLSTLNWKVPGAFSNSKGFSKGLPSSQSGPHTQTYSSKWPSSPGSEGTRLTGHLVHCCLEDLFFLTSDHNLDCFIPMHGFAFYKWMLIFNLSRYLVFSLLNFSPHEEN